MTAYTESEAKKAGWQIVHEQEETAFAPASYRAEKSLDGGIINEQAEGKDKLLERIGLYENDPSRVAPAQAPPVMVDDSFQEPEAVAAAEKIAEKQAAAQEATAKAEATAAKTSDK